MNTVGFADQHTEWPMKLKTIQVANRGSLSSQPVSSATLPPSERPVKVLRTQRSNAAPELRALNTGRGTGSDSSDDMPSIEERLSLADTPARVKRHFDYLDLYQHFGGLPHFWGDEQRAGRLPAIKDGLRVRFTRDVVEGYLRRYGEVVPHRKFRVESRRRPRGARQ